MRHEDLLGLSQDHPGNHLSEQLGDVTRNPLFSPLGHAIVYKKPFCFPFEFSDTPFTFENREGELVNC
jgi:hypothetical protein